MGGPGGQQKGGGGGGTVGGPAVWGTQADGVLKATRTTWSALNESFRQVDEGFNL